MSDKTTETRLARIRLMIRGRVQGVGFRFAASEQAKTLAVAGWVRNRPGREVEIVAEGERKNLQMLAKWAHRGPRYAMVDEVSIEWLPFSGDLKSFAVR